LGIDLDVAVLQNRSRVMSSAVETPFIPGVSLLAGKPAPKEMLIDVAQLEREYFERWPDANSPSQMVSFGTSGHRGSSQAICDYRRANGTDGPLYTRVDTPATIEQKAKPRELTPDGVTASMLAGEPIIAKLTRAPGDNAPIGGLKVVTEIYAEGFRDQSQLNAIFTEAEGRVAEGMVNDALKSSKGRA